MNASILSNKPSLEEIKNLQEQKLRDTLNYLKNNSKYYSDLFKKHNIDVSKIQSIQDLSSIPVTQKQDLQLYNKDFICVEEEQIIDYVTTSGTLGEPVTFILTEKDLERLAYNEYRSMLYAGITPKDIVQLTVTLDRRFMAGLAYFSGLRKLGAGIIRVGPGNPELQWDTINRLKPTVLIAVPSFILKLIEFAEEKHINYKESSIAKIICIGEPIRQQNFELNELSKKILEKWSILLHSSYASTEMSTAFTECKQGNGGHLIPELAIVECLDENNNEVKEGEPGEITITTLGIEGMPLLRFKTGDIAIVHKKTCECGESTYRVGPIMGRKGQMIKYKGTTLYPQSLFDILNSVSEVNSYFVKVYTNEIGTDELVAYISSNNQNPELEKQIKDIFRAKLRVAPNLKFVSEEEINKVRFIPSQRKPVFFVDQRNSK